MQDEPILVDTSDEEVSTEITSAAAEQAPRSADIPLASEQATPEEPALSMVAPPTSDSTAADVAAVSGPVAPSVVASTVSDGSVAQGGSAAPSVENAELVSALSALPAMSKNADGSLTTVTLAADDVSRLGTAGDYAMLAGSTMTNTGVSTVDGDMGLSPGTAATGFEPCAAPAPAGTNCLVLTGTQNMSNEAAAQAKADLLTAYTNLVGLEGASTCTYIETELGGKTLQAGVYCSTTGTFEITGTLTLDGPGEFIFLTGAGGTTLVTAADSQVALTNGANACDVYFQVGSSATLGSSSDIQGNILAQTSISLGAGATINGRAQALTGAVTMINNTVTAPDCAATIPPGDDTGGGETPPGDTGGEETPPGDTDGEDTPPGEDAGGGVTLPIGGGVTAPIGGGVTLPIGGGTVPATSAIQGPLDAAIVTAGSNTTGLDLAALTAALSDASSAAATSTVEASDASRGNLASTGMPMELVLLATSMSLGLGATMIQVSRRMRPSTTV